MLFRLHALFHRLESRRLAHAGGTLETIAGKLRAVSGIPTNCDMFALFSSAWVLQREEMYESGSHINENHLPIEVGDIFERSGTSSQKRFILLAQPCDLMVRGDGKRHPEIDRVPLAEVVCVEKAPYCSEELPYYGSSSKENWYVKLKLVHQIRLCILDLCALNEDGVARIIVGGDAPSSIRPAWKERYSILSRTNERTVRKAALLAPNADEAKAVTDAKNAIARDLEGVLFNEALFKGGMTEVGGVRTVTYNCKRVARLARTRAIGLLMSYTASLCRPAYDRDFVTIGPLEVVENDAQ